MNTKKFLENIVISIIFVSTLLGQNTLGLILNEPEAFPGYTLFAPKTSNFTFLIDNDGLLVHQWESNFNPAMTAYLLEDGSLLRPALITSETSQWKGGFQKFSWDGELLWEFYFGKQHHDIELLPNGNVLMVVSDVKSAQDAFDAGRNPDLLVSDNLNSLAIIEIEQLGLDSGRVVWEWYAWDHLIQDYEATKPNFGDVSVHSELIDINFANSLSDDWLHTNAVDYNPIFDQIIVSNRGTSEIWILDHSTTSLESASHAGGNFNHGGDLLYRWGNPMSYRVGSSLETQQLCSQHDAQWIESGLPGTGNILIFNNGLGRTWDVDSSVDEISPPVDELGNYAPPAHGISFDPQSLTWSYFSADAFIFLANRYGGAQRLMKGNTLICSGVDGILFEVTPALEIVWKYISPVSGSIILTQGSVPEYTSLARCTRYPIDFPGFEGRDMTPGDPIELYASGLAGEPVVKPSHFALQNFPNPFNPTTTIHYSLPQALNYTLTIRDIQGREVMRRTETSKTPGTYSMQWSGRDAGGRSVESGIYFCSLKGGAQSQTIKMVYLR